MSEIAVRAAGLLVSGQKILLVNHRKHERSYWVLPGGHARPGETLPDALRREMMEELALDVTVGELAIVHDFVAEDTHVVNHVFRVEAESTDFRVAPEKVLRGARWVSLEELDGIDLRPAIAERLRELATEPPGKSIYLGNL